MRRPIRWQILIPSAAALVVAMLAVSALNGYLAAWGIERKTEQQLRDIAHTLHASNFPLTDTVLKQMRGLSGGVDFFVTDAAGVPLAASRELAERLEVADTKTDWRQLELGPTTQLEHGAYYRMSLALDHRGPATHGGEPSRVLHILYPMQELREARWRAMWPSFAVGGIALAAVSILAFTLARQISLPISQLGREVRRLAEADFRPVPLPARDDEVRDLAVDINHLASQLNELRGTIQRTERLVLLGQLSGALAHHLRNDVTGARMAIQLHQRTCADDDPETLQVALRQLELAEQHLQRFLAAGAPRALQCAAHDLQAVVAESLAMVEPMLKHRQIELRRDLPAEPLEAEVDAEQLRHVILNLVFNAADAVGSQGWIEVALRTGNSPNGDAVANAIAIAVSDSGPGPDPEIESRLFETFATTKPEGAGLGLAVSRRIVEAHGGRLEFERGDGPTCFTITLPREIVAGTFHVP